MQVPTDSLIDQGDTKLYATVSGGAAHQKLVKPLFAEDMLVGTGRQGKLGKVGETLL